MGNPNTMNGKLMGDTVRVTAKRRIFPFDKRGFTLIELMIVITIVGILASIAVPNYQVGIIKAKEAVLREDLYNFRSVIDQFRADQGKYPDSIAELKDKNYLRDIPKDPITGTTDSWVTSPPPDPPATTGAAGTTASGSSTPVSPVTPPASDAGPGNVYDIHSGSNRIASNGTPYNEW